MNAGYASLGSCVTGPERGAMGVHFAKSQLIGDGVLEMGNSIVALATSGFATEC